jgi:hypothetical protein
VRSSTGWARAASSSRPGVSPWLTPDTGGGAGHRLDNAARRRVDHERRLAAQRADDEARREQARLDARERRLDKLADEDGAAWSRVEAMIATRKPAEYDAAVTLLTDRQALAEREDRYDTFTSRTITPRQTHARKPALIERLNQAGI